MKVLVNIEVGEDVKRALDKIKEYKGFKDYDELIRFLISYYGGHYF